jgi:hypothetical protein
MLALLYTRRSLWRRRDGRPKRLCPDRNGRNQGVGRGVDERDGVQEFIRQVGSGSIWRDGYPKRMCSNRKVYGRDNGVGRGVDDRNGVCVLIRQVGAGSIRRDGYLTRTVSNRNGSNHDVGRGVDDQEYEVQDVGLHGGQVGASSVSA